MSDENDTNEAEGRIERLSIVISLERARRESGRLRLKRLLQSQRKERTADTALSTSFGELRRVDEQEIGKGEASVSLDPSIRTNWWRALLQG